MNLQEWRNKREQGEEAILPSGLEITLRKVNLLELAKLGQIPQTLQALAEETMQGKRLTLAELGEVDQMLTLVAGACIVAPVGLDAAELDFSDKMAVFEWANTGAAKLQFFRRQQEKPVATAPAGK